MALTFQQQNNRVMPRNESNNQFLLRKVSYMKWFVADALDAVKGGNLLCLLFEKEKRR
jgi:hypothetical protein